ncbi:Thioredoxin reductase [Flexibacter flexilis DSM 6793]|uniref:Thioredoxin reductase n=1 Tax=Flexibacter flexilis DSM 6793 TaxID=927664 RepID=A0A1I1DVK8_9BACT|nr:NAD(P)/FAD-dependent oxidoreductase [Flexibacter flexilis]SFB76760.1 Thioredoxin reductase [Flexibacter flexilis DSM 6793]
MNGNKHFDTIIVGGSYSGLAAAMALGRALKTVLIIDSGQPCNRQTPHSHNFLTQDGQTPKQIANIVRQQVAAYNTIAFWDGLATAGRKTNKGFEIQISSGEVFSATKLIFATGIRDMMPNIKGLAECWGISVLHCPYCHGYEVRNAVTGILGNGESGFEFSKLIANWTNDLTLFTNGKSTLSTQQAAQLASHRIRVVETEIVALAHTNGQLQAIVFKDGAEQKINALYTRLPFEQHCPIPMQLGCELTEDGYLKVDAFQKTSIKSVFACGDNTTRMRTVANAVATGTATGMAVNKELTEERFS